MITNVRDIVDSIKEIAENDMAGSFPTVYYGSEFKEFRSKDYPICWFFCEGSANFTNNLVEVPMTFRLLDVVGSLNDLEEKDITAKTEIVRLADLLTQRMRSKGLFFGDINVGYETVYYEHTHGMSGVEFTVNCHIQKSCLTSLEIPQPPKAPNVNLFTFYGFKDISILNYCSDPDGLSLELDSVGKPDYGSIVLSANDIIRWVKPIPNDVAQGLVNYTIKNSAGLKDTGRILLAFEYIDLSITSPTENQDVPQGQDLEVVWTATPEEQNYIDRVELLLGGVVIDQKQPYEVEPFTIDGSLLNTLGSKSIRLRAYDIEENNVYQTNLRHFDVVDLIELTITSPTASQEIPNDEDITVSFTSTTQFPSLISAIALVVDGNEIEKRSPYSTSDFTITAGTLNDGNHSILLRAYDLNDEVVEESSVVSFEVVASAQYLLDLYPNQFGESFALHRVRTGFTGDLIEIKRDDGAAQRFALDGAELPIAAISSFVGSGDGKLTWWKGQANGLEVAQTSDGACPLLFESGSLITENGQPALKFSGAQWLNGGDIMNANFRPLISAAVARNTGTGQTVYAKAIAAGGIVNRYALSSHNQIDSADNRSYLWYNRFAIRNQVVNNGVHKAIDNNQLQFSENVTNQLDSNYDFLIGAFNTSSGVGAGFNFYIGNISEVHIWFEDVESQLSDINDFINQRYNIY